MPPETHWQGSLAPESRFEGTANRLQRSSLETSPNYKRRKLATKEATITSSLGPEPQMISRDVRDDAELDPSTFKERDAEGWYLDANQNGAAIRTIPFVDGTLQTLFTSDRN